MKLIKRSLGEIETHIEKCAVEIEKNGLEIGQDLCVIRDQNLWKSDGFDSFNQYLKAKAESLVGRNFQQAANYIQSAVVAKQVGRFSTIDCTENFTTTHYGELARLAPKDETKSGTVKDYSKLTKTVVGRVIKHAKKIADGDKISVRDLKKAVDKELGVDLKKVAAKAKKKREEDSQMDLDVKLRDIRDMSMSWLELLGDLPKDVWDILEENYPGLLDETADSLESLSRFLRS